MWCIYIIHQLNKGLDLNTAIHQELYGTGEDLYQNDRDIGSGSAITMPESSYPRME